MKKETKNICLRLIKIIENDNFNYINRIRDDNEIKKLYESEEAIKLLDELRHLLKKYNEEDVKDYIYYYLFAYFDAFLMKVEQEINIKHRKHRL